MIPACFLAGSFVLTCKTRLPRGGTPRPSPPPISSLFDTPRVSEAITSETSSFGRVLEIGSGLGECARALAKTLRASVVVAVETDAELSRRAVGLGDARGVVVFVRMDFNFSVDPVDVVNQHEYDVAIVRRRFSRNAKVVGWAAQALREGGVLVVEGEEATVGLLETTMRCERVRVGKGGWVESVECARRERRRAIARNEIWANVNCPQYPVYLLVIGVRGSEGIPPQARPRSISSSLIPLPSAPLLKHNSLAIKSKKSPSNEVSAFQKPSPTSEQRDEEGRRVRSGCICVMPLLGTPGKMDEKRVLLISSSKRPGEYILPSGRTEVGEFSEVGAVREAYEESGCRVQVLGHLGEFIDVRKKTKTQWFVGLVDSIDDSFLEAAIRKRLWVHLDDAIELVSSSSSKRALMQLSSKLSNF